MPRNERGGGNAVIVTGGRWREGPNGLTPSEYVYDMISKTGLEIKNWSRRKIMREYKRVPGSRSEAAAAHPLSEFPLSDAKRQEIEKSGENFENFHNHFQKSSLRFFDVLGIAKRRMRLEF